VTAWPGRWPFGLLALLVLGTLVFAPRTGASAVLSWEDAGSLAVPRAYAKALRLATGEVLIFGGMDAADPRVSNDTTELFDPWTGRSTVLPQRLPGRVQHSATSVWGDRVVIAGGSEWYGDHWEVMDRVDVFRVSTREWVAARPMLHRRTGHGATALLDGRLLVAGGYDGPRLIATVEIYDPRTDRWTDARPLPLPRGDFTMATLPDGRVLVAGGLEGKDSLVAHRALLYDPLRDRWTDGGPQIGDRVLHTSVTLANGDVLLIGGQRSGSNTAERYDVRTHRFLYAGALVEPRMLGSAAALPDGRVLLVGGLPVLEGPRDFTPSARAELWDPATNRWEDAPADLVPRVKGQLVPTDVGLLELTGAGAGEQAVKSVERFFAR